MNIAFYAPLKPPTAPTPSGDRAIARALMAAMGSRGHTVELAARLRAREPAGDPQRQRRLREVGGSLAERLVRRYRNRPAERPALWFTYHLYYKAPDWIGPHVAEALDIPYVVAEPSFAPKQADGPWRESHDAVRAAIARADLLFSLNSANDACVRPLLRDPARLVALKPFAASARILTLPQRGRAGRGTDVSLLTVAQMRPGAKLESYRVLADAMRLLPATGWTLTVLGDGLAEAEVRALFDGLPVVFAGRQEPERFYAAADVFVWPAIDEAFGMAIVEAQAAGLPVVAGCSGGVADTVQDGATGVLVPPGDADAFAAALGALIADGTRRRAMGEAAAASAHRFEDAARLIDDRLRALA